MSVLFIEDDEGVAVSVSAVLHDEGYRVEVVRNGAAALARLAHGPRPNLILLDLMMPEMDGIAFRRAQLADPELCKIPVIIVSARPDVGYQARRLGADDYLQKPMSFEALLHAVQNRATTAVGDAD